MQRSSIERLTALRHELDGLPAEEWSRIVSWVAKATPVIRQEWSNHFDDFREAAATPNWASFPIALGRNEAENEARISAHRADTSNANRGIANNAKARTLSFVDGLLALAETDSSAEAPRKRDRKNVSGKPKTRPQADVRKVFVVHGRNNAAREALFTFLRSIGLRPLEWSEIVQATGKASPYIGEVLEKGFSIAQAVVILMTPDDEARLREPYRGSAEPAHETELTPQPRPNVLLEGGMALGLFPDRTVIVELGTLRPVSDIGGRHVIRMNDTSERRHELAQRLQTAGCEVNTTGTDWYKAGTFAGGVGPPRSKGKGKRSKP